MGFIKFMTNGTWFIVSKTDPRWNVSGYGDVGMFSKPREIDMAIAAKKQELNEDPPDDLEWGYMKD